MFRQLALPHSALTDRIPATTWFSSPVIRNGIRRGDPTLRGTSILLQGWPSLARLWCRGDLRALPPAITFGVLLDVLLMAVLWPDLLHASLKIGLGFVLAAWWCVGVWMNHQFLVQWRVPAHALSPELNQQFVDAQSQYLKGHWPETQIISI